MFKTCPEPTPKEGPLSDPPNPGAPRRALPQARPQALWRAERTTVREHDKEPRTPLEAFLNILLEIFHAPKPRMRIRIPLAEPISERPPQQAWGGGGGSAFDDEVIVIKESA